MTRAAIDERGFELARRIRQAYGETSLSELKALVREQFNMLLIDQEAALAAIPAMLPSTRGDAAKGIRSDKAGLRRARRNVSRRRKRMSEVARLFAMDKERSAGKFPFAEP